MSECNYHPLYLRGVEQFNRCEFFQSHEIWEELWLQVKGEERLFFKGLIQAAVALYHLSNGNAHGAGKLLAGARRYLEPFGSKHLGLDLDRFLGDLRCCVNDALRNRAESGRPMVNPAMIPKIHLKPSPDGCPSVR